MKPYSNRDFIAAETHISLTTGETMQMLRELKEWTQKELSKRSSIKISNISLLENDRTEIEKKRAIQLSRTFDVHPAMIMFPKPEEEENLKIQNPII